MSDEKLKVIGLEIKDFLAIKHLKLGKDTDKPIPEDLALFAGTNSTGKSDILKAVEVALLGSTETSLIRNGADKFEIILDLGKYRNYRSLTRGGTKGLKVTTEDKSVSTGLQSFIDDLIGIKDKSRRAFLFNPINLVLSDDKAKYLRDMFRTTLKPEMLSSFVLAKFLVGLNYEKDGMEILEFLANEKNGIVYVDRKKANTTVTEKKALLEAEERKVEGFDSSTYDAKQVETLKNALDTKQKEITAAETQEKLKKENQGKIEQIRTNIEKSQEEIKLIPQTIDELISISEDEIAKLDTRIAELEDELERLNAGRAEIAKAWAIDTEKKKRKEDLEKSIQLAEQYIADLTIKDIPDIEALKIEQTALECEQTAATIKQAKFQSYQRIQQTLKPEYTKAQTDADSLTDILKKLRKDLPDQLVKEANMPFEGLKFEGDKAFISVGALNKIRMRLGSSEPDRKTLDGEPIIDYVNLDNLSTSEAMLFGLMGSEKMNADSPFMVICMDKAECLDSQSMKVLRSFAESEQRQILATYVLHEGEKIPQGALLMSEITEQGKLV